MTEKKKAREPRQSPRRKTEPKRVCFGGALVREFTALPGMLEALHTVTRRFKKADFTANIKPMEDAFGKTNGTEVVDDFGTTWPPGSLIILGGDGVDNGPTVMVVFKFVPIARVNPPVDLSFLSLGTGFAPME